jgi:Ca-activated chloride channel family protein
MLKADWVTDAKRAIAADFLTYVQSSKVQKRFTDAAFRDFEGKPGALINPSQGLLPAEPKAVIGAPAPAVLAGVKDSWEKLRKRARVLLVLDVSGSMGDPVGSAGTTKLELAKAAAAKAVAQLAPDDLLSLWIFSTQQDHDKPYRELVPFDTARTNLATVQAKIRDLQPDGGTGLYATVRAASKALGSAYDPQRINAIVVLTDGRNEFPADNNIASLVDALDVEDSDRAVRVFPIAYGEDADLGELTKIADASRAAAYDASDPASIDNVLTAVLSNF